MSFIADFLLIVDRCGVFMRRIKFKMILTISMLLFCWTGFSEAKGKGIIYCSSKSFKCAVELKEGFKNDIVKILDEKAIPIAEARIVKKRGSYALVKLLKYSKTIKRNYPVVVHKDHLCEHDEDQIIKSFSQQ